MYRTIEDYRKELASGGQLHLKCIQLYFEEPSWSTPRSLDRSSSKPTTCSTGTRNILKALERRVRHSNSSSNPIMKKSYMTGISRQIPESVVNLSSVESYTMTHSTSPHHSPIESKVSSSYDTPLSFPSSSSSHSYPLIKTITPEEDQLELRLREIEQFLKEDIGQS
jgi:hypothetical protein